MKFALLFALIFLSSFSVQAQENTFIAGSWKIITISDADMYLNLETDSSFLSPEMVKIYPDTPDQKKMMSDARIIFGSTQFHFEKNGIFKQTVDTMTIFTGTYKIDVPNRKLELTSKNSFGEDVTEKMDYDFIDNRLKFSILLDDTKLHLVLRKFVK